MKEDKYLKQAEKYIIYAIAFLAPISFAPIFPNPFVIPKLAILGLGIVALLVIKASRIIFTGSITMSSATFDLPVGLFALAYLAAGLLVTPNKMEAFLFPGTATLVVLSAILYFFINSLTRQEKKNTIMALFFSGVVASLASILAASGILSTIPGIPPIYTNPNFSLLSGALPVVLFTGALLPYGILSVVGEKQIEKKAMMGILTVILLLGLGLSIFNILPGKPTSPRLLNLGTSWSVAVDTIKESPLLGVGPGSYLTSFNRFRPLEYNSTDNWNLKFTQGRNFYLTILTETGFAGAASIVFLLVVVYRYLKKNMGSEDMSTKKLIGSSESISLIAILVLLAFFSPTPSIIVLLFVLLAVNSRGKKTTINLSAGGNKLPAFIISVPIIVGCGVFVFYSFRALRAEARYQKALVFLQTNQGKQTYDTLREAININPFVDRYHATYSQVNIALAQSLAQSPDITDDQRTTIAQLIQQAIREGKATVTLNQQRAGNWEILAAIYRSVMPFAQGADAFTVQTYAQAVALDPINPNLRINLGGVYFALGNYDEAIKSFDLATLAKPDHANSHFNLSAAYREKGDVQRAINEMELVLSIVDPESQDFQTATQEIQNLEKAKLDLTDITEEATRPETLTPPQPAPDPALTPPLDLPVEASPPDSVEQPPTDPIDTSEDTP